MQRRGGSYPQQTSGARDWESEHGTTTRTWDEAEDGESTTLHQWKEEESSKKFEQLGTHIPHTSLVI